MNVVIREENRPESMSAGEIAVQTFSDAERRKRAIKTFGLVYGIGFVCIFFPVLHFILVPSALLLGPFLTMKVYKTFEQAQGGRGVCPSCKKEFQFQKQKIQFPMQDSCEHCRTTLVLNKT